MTGPAEVRIGMLGSGFIGEFHAWALERIPGTRITANHGAGPERRAAFAARFGSRPLDSIGAVCADPEVDLVVVSLPNHLHLEAVRVAAAAGKAVACTKPLGRSLAEADAMVEAVERAGVFHAYLENVVYVPEVDRMRSIAASGAIGRVISFRAREAHSGPHAAHFWDADLAGGGALLDMASHGSEAARTMIGKDVPVRDVFAWGATLVHGDKTTGEDSAIALIRFEDERVATCDVSWTSRGGLEGRFELVGETGRIVSDLGATGFRAFLDQPAGYLGEKADAETGWVFPVPDEVHAHGHQAMFADVIEAYRAGHPPRETFHDGRAVNAILDAAYRSMASGRWEAVAAPAAVGAR